MNWSPPSEIGSKGFVPSVSSSSGISRGRSPRTARRLLQGNDAYVYVGIDRNGRREIGSVHHACVSQRMDGLGFFLRGTKAKKGESRTLLMLDLITLYAK